MTLLNPWTLLVWMALWAILIQALGRRLRAWARAALAVGGMTGAAILAVALRLSADSAPAALPWPASLGRGPALAADAAMFPFAAILILTLAGAMLADVGAWDRWPRAGLLAAAALFSVYAENLLALAMAWILLEVLTWGRSGADEADEASIGAWSAFWGSVGLAAILWVWHETQGASLRPYEVAAWTPRARMLLVGVVLYVNLSFYGAVRGALASFILVGLVCLTVLWLAMLFYTGPFLIEQEDKRLRLALRNAAFLALATPGYTLTMLAATALIIVLSVLTVLPLAVFTLSFLALLGNRAVIERLRTFGKLPAPGQPPDTGEEAL